MSENGNKKRRIARIGHISIGKEGTQLRCEDGLIQADANIVYGIMESMDKSRDVKSLQQLQKFRSKEKSADTNNSVSSSSCKQNSKASSSKQIKKIDSGKKYPLMAKCQQVMKNLKKNRSMPKPRAHVGPSQTPISKLQSNMYSNQTVVNNAVNHKKENSMKKGENSKNGCLSEIKRPKKAKGAHSIDNSCDTNASPTEKHLYEEPKFVSDADTDSDNEFERFIQKHYPEKDTRKRTTNNIKCKKKMKQFVCAKKTAKVTSRALSESEESAESEVDHSTATDRQGRTLKRYRRIIEDSEDSATDYHVNDSGTLNHDSFSSSEDENTANKSLNKKNDTDYNINRECMFPDLQSTVISSISSHECKDSLYNDELKLKCNLPCFVLIKRDPLLDKRAASRHIDHSPVINTISVSNSNDDGDDCMIIDETSTMNFADQNSENNASIVEDRNSNLGDLTIMSKSPCVSESTSIDGVQNGYMPTDKLIINPSNLELQTEKNSNEKSAESLLHQTNVPKEVSHTSVTALRNSLRDTEKEECQKNENLTECTDESATVENPVSHQMSNLRSNETDISLYRDTATEKELFNVQILSVKSLSASDVIVLSDDDDEEAGPAMNETRERVEEDSDIEIICLDSSIVREEKCVKDDLNNETLNKENDLKENSSSSTSQPLASVENDCIILDDLDLPSENTSTTKNIDAVEPSSQSVDMSNNETTNPSKNGKIGVDRVAILKTLASIDINCINKVLSETTIAAADTRKESIPAKAGNSALDNIEIPKRASDSIPAKPKRSQDDTCLSQEQTASIAPIRSSNVNNKISSSNTSADVARSKLGQNSDVLQNIKSGFGNVPSAKNSNKTSSDACDENSTVSTKSSANNVVPKSFVSRKDMSVSSSNKTAPNALLHSPKNQQLLPMHSKIENYENPADELDLIAAKSIKDLNETEKNSIVPLLELYRAEYEKFMNIKCTEENVTAGLKLLEEKQARKLLAISSSIKNIVKKDVCFHKINNEVERKRKELKCDSAEKNESVIEIKKPSKTSISSYPDIEKDDKVKIFNQSVVKTASEYLKSDGPSNSQEVYNHLINSVCAECGKHAVFACLGCAKAYYCSEDCGMTNWNKGHYQTCKR